MYKAINDRIPQVLLLAYIILFSTFTLNAQSTVPRETGYAPANGIKIYYEVYGEGKPLILLHGAFSTINMNWAELIPGLSKSRKVIAIEMQSHGHTAYSERKMDIKTFASDVEKVLDHLKIDSADVAGYSMGGSVAYQFAVQSPKRLRKLVIISSTYKSGGWLPIGNEAFKDFKPDMFDDTPIKSEYDLVAPDKNNWRKFITQMIGFVRVKFNVGDDNIAKIAAPVLIIAGDNDGTDKVELIKTYQLLGGNVFADMQPMPESQLAIVPSQGHVSIMMQTATILKYMSEFLD